MKKMLTKKPLGDYSVIQWVNFVADMVLLSILWTVCALPVVTVGVASAALFHTAVKVLTEERGNIFPSFVQSVRDSWRTALPVGAAFALVCSALLFLAYRILVSGLSELWLLLTACAVLLAHLTLVQLHLYPLLGRYVLTGRETVTLVVKLTSSHFFRNAALLALFLATVSAALLYPPLVLFILPAGYAWLAAKLQTPMFARLIRTAPEPGPQEQEQ